MEFSKVIVYLWVLLAPVANLENKRDFLPYRPFTAYCVWDRSKNNDIQRHYMSRIMDNTTIGTRIILNTVDAIQMDFKHNKTQTMSTEIVKINDTRPANNIISYTSLKEDIWKRLQTTEIRAFELYFFVSDNTRIDQEEAALDGLKRFKVFVVYSGPDPVPILWTSLATNEHHLLHVKGFKTNKPLSDYIDVMLHDSRLLCDTDMFWTGTHCVPCNFTCTDKKSDHCKTTCPYFEKASMDSDSCTEICVCNTILSLVLMIIIILCCIVLYNKKLYLRLRKYISRKCKRGGGRDTNTNRTEEQLNSNNGSEVDDGAETSVDQPLVRVPSVNGNRNVRRSPKTMLRLQERVPPANGNVRQNPKRMLQPQKGVPPANGNERRSPKRMLQPQEGVPPADGNERRSPKRMLQPQEGEPPTNGNERRSPKRTLQPKERVPPANGNVRQSQKNMLQPLESASAANGNGSEKQSQKSLRRRKRNERARKTIP